MDTGNVVVAVGATTYVNQNLALPITAIKDGFDMDHWSVAYVGNPAPSTLTVHAIGVNLIFFADMAGTIQTGAVGMPLIAVNLLPSSEYFINVANAYVNYQFGPDVQSPFGFSRFWQLQGSVYIQNQTAGALNATVNLRCIYR